MDILKMSKIKIYKKVFPKKALPLPPYGKCHLIILFKYY